MASPVYEVITGTILEALEKGVVPWHKPWASPDGVPTNLVSKKAYRGVNSLLLGMKRQLCGYTSPYWLTYRQAKQIGGQVRKGQKSTPVIFWRFFPPVVRTDEDGNVLTDATGKVVKRSRPPVCRYYNVFNADQCDGIEDKIPVTTIGGAVIEPIEECERIVESMPQKPAIEQFGGVACYLPSQDKVCTPHPDAFESAAAYYSTLFHELGHATGHASRLDRKSVTECQPFGSEVYSKEELVAEMCAAFLCGTVGIENNTVNNSAAYIGSWLKKLRDDTKMVVFAAAQAQKAADFVLGVGANEQDVKEAA